jgi:hypothetical protein
MLLMCSSLVVGASGLNALLCVPRRPLAVSSLTSAKRSARSLLATLFCTCCLDLLSFHSQQQAWCVHRSEIKEETAQRAGDIRRGGRAANVAGSANISRAHILYS